MFNGAFMFASKPNKMKRDYLTFIILLLTCLLFHNLLNF